MSARIQALIFDETDYSKVSSASWVRPLASEPARAHSHNFKPFKKVHETKNVLEVQIN